MRLNKNCPHYADCKKANDKMDALWRYGCPAFVGIKRKVNFADCTYYERYEDAVQNDRGTAQEHQSEVQ